MKTAIITGAAGNLGRAVVNRLHKDGYNIYGTLALGEKAPESWPVDRMHSRELDALHEASAENYVKEVVTAAGSVDLAVLTVGGFAMGEIAATSSADILQQYRLNFETAYHLARPLFVHMKERGQGRIFLIGSRPGLSMQHSAGMVAYGLSKSLIFRLAELMNAEAAGTDVNCCVIVPSTIDTAANRRSMPDADFSKWVTPEAIADVIAFYGSGEGRAIREAVIKLYGRS